MEVFRSSNEKLMGLLRHDPETTFRKEILSDMESFAGAFDLSGFKDMERPVIVSSCNGIGAKIKVALSMQRFDTIGTDCVAKCVNDIMCMGAEPLFFMHHIACARSKTDIIGQISEGITKGLEEAEAATLGGEISELSDLYGSDELGVVGFITGIVDEKDMIDGSTIKPGNSVLGIASSGLHSNGYSEVRSAFRNFNEGILNTYFDNINGTLGDVILRPTKIYSRAIRRLKNENIRLRGVAHITGGSFKENITRILPEGVTVEINTESFAHPPIFTMIEEAGGFSKEEMYDTFNMGIGMVVIVASQDRETALRAIRHSGDTAFIIGSVKEGLRGVNYVD